MNENLINFLRNVTNGDDFVEMRAEAQMLYINLVLSAWEVDGSTDRVHLSCFKAGADGDDLKELAEKAFVEVDTVSVRIIGYPTKKGDG